MNRHITGVIFASLLLFAGCYVSKGGLVIHGQLTEGASGRAVPGADVRLCDSTLAAELADSAHTKTWATTDRDGRFTLVYWLPEEALSIQGGSNDHLGAGQRPAVGVEHSTLNTSSLLERGEDLPTRLGGDC